MTLRAALVLTFALDGAALYAQHPPGLRIARAREMRGSGSVARCRRWAAKTG
jgi:hypothetical protein